VLSACVCTDISIDFEATAFLRDGGNDCIHLTRIVLYRFSTAPEFTLINIEISLVLV
jgi:hypothetical protein